MEHSVEYVIAKAANRLYAPRSEIVEARSSQARNHAQSIPMTYQIILEYAAQVQEDIAAYLSDAVEYNTEKIFNKNNTSKLQLSTGPKSIEVDRIVFNCRKLTSDMRIFLSTPIYDKIYPISGNSKAKKDKESK